MIVPGGLSNVDYDYVVRQHLPDEDLPYDGRFMAVLAPHPTAEDPVEMLFDAIEADEAAAEQLVISAEIPWWYAEKPVKYEDDGDVLWA